MKGQGFCGARARRAESSLNNLQIPAMRKDWPACEAHLAQPAERKGLNLVVVGSSARWVHFREASAARGSNTTFKLFCKLFS